MKNLSTHPPASDSDLLRTLLENLPDSIYFKDAASRFIRISKAQAIRCGLENPDEAVGKADLDFFTAEHAEATLRDEEEIMRTGQPMVGKEEKVVWPDGHVTWNSTTKMPLRDESGRVIGTFGVSRNITRLKEVQQALKDNQERLRLQMEVMERDMQVARVIQTSLLPTSPPQHPRLRIDYRYSPCAAVGGDFLSFHSFSQDALGLFVGDLTGHGVAAALSMSLVKVATERVASRQGLRPEAFLKSLNHELLHKIPFGFVTAIYGVFRFEERPTFTFSDAGHPPPIRQLVSTGQAELMAPGEVALGLIEDFRWEACSIPLEPGDRLFFYTDGLSDPLVSDGGDLGYERLASIVQKARRDHLSETLEGILEQVVQEGNAGTEMDDIALVGVEVL